MAKQRYRLLGAALALFVLGACGPEERLELELDFLPAIALEDSLVYVERSGATAHVVALGDSLSEVRVAVGTAPALAVARSGHDEVLVLGRGERGRAGLEPEEATLTVVGGGAEDGARLYTIGSPFNALAQSADGRFAVAFFREGAGLERLLFNPNEVAIVDLDAEPSATNPVLRTVRSFGGVPTDVTFSPLMDIAGESGRSLALVSSPAYVTLLDLDHPERSEITVRLTLEGDARLIRPSQFVFDPDTANIYLRGDSADDIYVLSLVEVPSDERVSNDFRPIVNQLGAGRQPSDMALYDVGAGPRLLVVAPGSSEAVVIENTSNATTTLPLGFPASEVLRYRGVAPGDPEVRERALLIPADDRSAMVAFVDLELLEERGGRNIETMTLTQLIRGSLRLPDRNLVLLVHSQVGAEGVSLLDLEERTIAPIFAEVSLGNAQFDAEGTRLWVAAPGTRRLGWLDLDNFHPGEVRLDAPVGQVFAFGPGDEGGPTVVVSHAAATGWLTVLDAQETQRETATSHFGFLLSELFDRSAP